MRLYAVQHPAMPEEAMRRMLDDPDRNVLESLITNPRAPIEILIKLMEDPRLYVYAYRALLRRLDDLPKDVSFWLWLWERAREEDREQIQAHPFGAQVAVLAGLGKP